MRCGIDSDGWKLHISVRDATHKLRVVENKRYQGRYKMKELKEAQMGIITVLALMLVSIKRRLPATRKLSSGITTLTLAGIVLLVAAGSVSAANCGNGTLKPVCQCGDTVVGDFTFIVDMVCPNTGDGLIIGANNIVIDSQQWEL
jgi:hypothetical protein